MGGADESADEEFTPHFLDTPEPTLIPKFCGLYCHHEAGHVVAAWVLHSEVSRVNVIRDGPFFGKAIIGHGDWRGVRLEDLIITQAGPSAARRYDPRLPDGGEQDRIDIERGLGALCRSVDVAEVVRRHVEAEADRIIGANWDAVTAIADALLRRRDLTGSEVMEVLGDILADRSNATEPDRRRRWAEVEARAAEFEAVNTRTA